MDRTGGLRTKQGVCSGFTRRMENLWDLFNYRQSRLWDNL